MGRRPGSRNADYASAREEILARLVGHLVRDGRMHESFRELAHAAGVTPSTLRHYFGAREGVVGAALARLHQDGIRYLAAGATEVHGDVAESLAWFLSFLREGWDRGVGKAHAVGLTEGLGDAALGQAYLTHLLEPTLQAAEARIARHVAQGELGPCDVRAAALELVAPVVLALLHQRSLGGAAVRTLDVERFLAEHVARFLRAHAPEAVSAPAPRPKASAGPPRRRPPQPPAGRGAARRARRTPA
ncbi:MAG: TetR/AcrR family transcriptional regulator [Anaeromyxobacter sp.]